MKKNNAPATDCDTPFWAWLLPGIALIIIGMLFIYDDAASAQSKKLPPIIAPTRSLKPSNLPEAYGPDTLYQKINGQAEFYLSAGFVSLKSQWYETVGDVDRIIEVNIYHMGNLLNAFSVFSLQRRDNSQTIDVTQFAYRAGNSIYFVHGPYYVEMLSIASLGARVSMMKVLAEQFVRDTPIREKEIHELAFFPAENQIKGSALLISNNAFGYNLLDNVFTTEYIVSDDTVTAYISKRKTSTEAKELAIGLHVYFKSFGGKPIESNTDIEGARMIEIMGTFDLMFSIGEYFAGVHEAPTQKQAETIAKMLAASLQEKNEEITD